MSILLPRWGFSLARYHAIHLHYDHRAMLARVDENRFFHHFPLAWQDRLPDEHSLYLIPREHYVTQNEVHPYILQISYKKRAYLAMLVRFFPHLESIYQIYR